MKKLLLFVLILFGILSVQSFAVNYGCGENIPPYVCGAAPPPSNSSSSYNNYSGSDYSIMYQEFAYDKDSGAYGSGKNVKRNVAKKTALTNCGTAKCKITLSGGGFVVVSSNGVVLSVKTNNLEYTKYMEKQSETLKKCENTGGFNCKIIYDTKNFHYDVEKEYPDRGW